MSEDLTNGGDWGKWSKLVLVRLKEHGTGLDGVNESLHDIDKRLALLEQRMAIRSVAWGSIGTLAMFAVGLVIYLIRNAATP